MVIQISLRVTYSRSGFAMCESKPRAGSDMPIELCGLEDESVLQEVGRKRSSESISRSRHSSSTVIAVASGYPRPRTKHETEGFNTHILSLPPWSLPLVPRSMTLRRELEMAAGLPAVEACCGVGAPVAAAVPL